MGKSFSYMIFIAGIFVCMSAVLAQDRNKVNIFGDGYDNAAFLAENYKLVPLDAWRAEDGCLVARPSGVASAVLKKEIPAECEVEVEITPLEVKHNFAGIIFQGINFLIRPDGYWCPYRVEGIEKSLGAMVKADIKANQKYHFRIACRKTSEAKMFSWFVNDVKIAEFIEAGKIQGGSGFSLFANKMPVAYDNLCISRLVEGKVPRNLLGNSSFERLQDDYPLGWKLGDPTSMLNYTDTIDKFWQSWGIEQDKVNVRSGKRSLRLQADGNSGSPGVQSHQAGISIGRPVTCSIYVKSDTDNLPVIMNLWETYGKAHSKEFKVGKEWTRCQMVVPSPAMNSIRIGMTLKAKGTIWLDDAQIELGETATEYELSALDSGVATAAEEPVVFSEKLHMLRFKTSPVIDGKIEDAWREMARTDQFLIRGKTVPEYKTEAFIGYDDDNLYLAFRCHSGDLTKLRATGKDGGAIWADDCIEIFIDSALSRSRYLHLGLNCAGTKAAFDGNKQVRTDLWEVKTSQNAPEKCWEAEVKLPLSMLGLTKTTGDEWGINLCRNETSKSEQSCTALTPRVNFHDVTYYGSIVWPTGMLDKFAIDVADLSLLEAADTDNLVISGVLRCRTGADRNPSIQLFSNNRPMTEMKSLAMGNDHTAAFSLACEPGLAKKDAVLNGNVLSGKGEPLKIFEEMVKMEKRIDTYTQRNYYMNEENAVLVVRLAMPLQSGMVGTVSVIDKDKKVLWTGNIPALRRSMRIDVPIKGLPVGTYDVQLDIKNNGKSLATANSPLLKLAYEKNGTQIDRERRCLIVDGKPFLVIAPLIHLFTHPTEYIRKVARHWAASGFKTVMVVKNSSYPDFKRTFDDTLAVCEENGLKTILWPGYNYQGDARAECERVMAPFRNAPSLIAWLPVDEPELSSTPVADKVIACIQECRRMDPYHPSYMNNSVLGIPSRYADLTTDILSIDYYVTKLDGDHKVADVLSQVAVMTKAGEKEQKPAWMFLSGNNLHNHYREPSVGEQVAQSYGTIITGCSGMYYFMGQPSCKLHWEALKQINQELLSLNDVIFSLEDAPAVAINSSSVISMTRRLGDSLYVISVNVEDRPIDTAVMIPDSLKTKGAAEVLFEGRSVDVKDGRFNDRYAPHQRHVYKISL